MHKMQFSDNRSLVPIIRIVDDDLDLLDAMDFMLRSEGWTVRTYQAAKDFFAHDDNSSPGCILLDYCMPEMNGLEMQIRLAELPVQHPIIFLTAHADVDMVISAFRSGADDLLRKPVDARVLFATVAEAVRKDIELGRLERSSEADVRFSLLTDRESQILNLANQGLMNRQIAERLGLSERTVETHRANGYRKLGVRTLAELALLMSRKKNKKIEQI